MSKLVNDLIKDGYLKKDAIIDAMERVDRIEFVPEEMELLVSADVALPIGYGQAIPKPVVVAFMLDLLDPQEGEKILDVGSGSGWITTLLAMVVGKLGHIISLERMKSLSQFASRNTDKFGFVKGGRVEFFSGEISEGFSQAAPYDKILVSPAVVEAIPQALKDQLKVGGKMVIPIGNSIIYLERESETDFFREEFPGFDFVPFILN